jgi:hypothetical protein
LDHQPYRRQRPSRASGASVTLSLQHIRLIMSQGFH